MNTAKVSVLFRRIDQYELALCLVCNRIIRRRPAERGFVLVSRLGDGLAWYVLIAVLPLVFGRSAYPVSLRMTVVGVVGLLLYKYLKSTTIRQRPFLQHKDIRRGTAPLDFYSFPSGHTLHAVAFTAVAWHYYPQLGWLLVPFTMLVALSRLALGLHYPSDVAAGAAIGLLLARVVLAV